MLPLSYPDLFVSVSIADEGLWELVARNLPASAQSHTIPLLQFHSDTSYAFRVFARNAHGLGSPSPPSPAISGGSSHGFTLLGTQTSNAELPIVIV